ncbi:ESF1 homolog [Haematobia irritans]|uniref:ESF1 homolog n=1 Tax=Haematobia irritans TaxID=7368 RepID=UPI003F4FB780
MAKDKLHTKPKGGTPSTSKQNKTTQGDDARPSGIWQDERFQHLVTDPRFKNLPKVQRKVKIDKRFEGMFTNDKFKVKYTVDKYGRRVNKSTSEDLRKYYELNSSDEEDEDDDRKEDSEEKASEDEDVEREKEEKAIVQESDVEDENDALTSDDEEVPKTLRERLLNPDIDYARGEGRLITDSSSDDESSEDEDPEMYIDHVWGELDNDADTTDESTRRLAVCNMDWDRIRAVDLMVLFSSFLPRGGTILSVKIYPSEFGKERMKEEELHGPPELVGLDKDSRNKNNDKTANAKNKKKSESSDSEDDLTLAQDSDAEEGDDYHMEKLRQYQLNRLRYYYAVVEFDSIETADKIYKECDGIEYESSATKVDLRYIPDDTTFDDDEPSDVCTEMPDISTYQPRQFTTTALQQAKVDLTWDETEVDRKELGDKLSSGKLDGISDKDLRKIVAYSSEEEEEDNETGEDVSVSEEEEEVVKKEKEPNTTQKVDKKSKKKAKKEEAINKYRALLAEINEKEQKEKEKKKYAMEFTWEVNEANKDDEKDKDEDLENKPKADLTPIEKVLLKRSEKNKKRKEERKKKKLQAAGVDSESDLDSLPDGIDMNDPYFAEEFANGDFIDPKAKRKEKQKKQKQLKAEQEEEDEKQAKELELLLDDNQEEESKQHFSLEKILKNEQDTKSKKKRRKQLKKSKTAIEDSNKPVEDNFHINLSDNRFKAVFTSHEFNIDPTDPHFKKTKGMEQLIHEKLKRRHGEEEGGDKSSAGTANGEIDNAKRPKKNLENIMLAKSLKRKIQMKQQGR